ncbi:MULTISPECIES: chromosomal replication initiator protein DnaA [Allofrancisella]|uniref:Chromosomal replication initiator protein DnaA n=2 Tax=Allofrancisella TaxID=1869285 RepID=A0A6M3HRP9_9GAMM|nr:MULTISPECIES: chromosomal replication initiator protein DnaA [Allofrancisella]KEI35176.1 chromosomal replication initiator protein DnaA [Francisella sp. W12-1067]QIV93829.1 chromosomal replication initiator protein DnaA [Allofrancisella frigidaquae]QIV95309.1 chromosomal replication initiator protein DnaA [Allofrancisella inopinata]TDT69072.1 chromosomal replication initiator protein DnaA [Allofrancisella inopinata]
MATWNKCLKKLKKDLTTFEYKTWIKPITVVQNANLFTIYCNNEYFKKHIKAKYGNIIISTIQEHHGNDLVVEYSNKKFSGDTSLENTVSAGPQANFFSSSNVEIKDDIEEHTTVIAEPTKTKKLKQIKPSQELFGFDEAMLITAKAGEEYSFGLPLKEKYVFDSFVVGDANKIARAAAMQVSINPGKLHNPLFIYGGSGLGKTHLMQAIGNHARDVNPQAKIIYTNSEQFIKDYVNSIRLQDQDEFQRVYRSADILLIDDIQFIAGKEGTAQEFFHTFNSLYENGKQIILTSDKYPNEIEGLEERLVSRFGYGLTVSVDMPDLETRIAILLKKAHDLGQKLPNETAVFIAENVRTNVRELEGALNRVLTTSRFNYKEPTVEVAQSCLRDIIKIQEKKVKIDNIQKVVADFYRIRVKDLTSNQRSRNIARPRQIAMSLARELTSHSLPEIGNAFGGRDHTTVMHAVKAITKLRQSNTSISDDYELLLDKISR